ncbi:MAG: hypothetical protein J6R04_00980, partial [Clostridia bacterium]|nr:hypothetical protein [Clostridia bacterium]
MMKKTLALILAAMMIFSSLVFTTAAEESALTEDEVKIIPVSDGTEKDGAKWYGNVNCAPVGNLLAADGTVTASFTGIPAKQSPGQALEVVYSTPQRLDISGMKTLAFDLYLENAAAVVNASYNFELRSNGSTGDNYEITVDKTLTEMCGGLLVDGWNHVEFPLSLFSNAQGNNAFDRTQWSWFRMFHSGSWDGTNKVTNYNSSNIIGSEGKTTVVKIDNVYFTSAEAQAPYNAQSSEVVVNSGVNAGNYAGGSASDSKSAGNINYFSKKLNTPVDLNQYSTLNFDVYLSHVDAASRSFNLELTSSGEPDNQEDGINATIATWAEIAGVELVKGWNRIELPLGARVHTAGQLTETEFNFLRIFNSTWTAGTEVDGVWKPTYEDGATRTIVFARATLGGKRSEMDEIQILDSTVPSSGWGGGSSISGSMTDVLNADGVLVAGGVETDGLPEWVWYNEQSAAKKIKYQDALATFTLTHDKPMATDLYGIEFDIWVSDAAFGESSVCFELSSAGKCDWEEISLTSSLNTVLGTTLEAGKWQTVIIPISRLTTKSNAETRGTFDPAEFDYMRLWFNDQKDSWTEQVAQENELVDVTRKGRIFANGLVVALRDIKALNHPMADSVWNERGDLVIDMESGLALPKAGTITSATITLPRDGNRFNKAVKLIDVAAGGTLVAASSAAVNSMNHPLTESYDISQKDYIGFDLYLENVADWGSKVKFLFGLSSYGDCDHEQIHVSGFTIPQMFGDYVVNADGTKGTLKDGWNRIEMPIYTLFPGSIAQASEQYEADGTTYRDNSFDPTRFNYFRAYTQGGTVTTATSKVFAALDNLTFFDGGNIGTNDQVYDFGFGEKYGTIWSGSAAVGSGNRQQFVMNHSMDSSDKDTLLMDVRLSDADAYTGSFYLEIGNNWKCDDKEYSWNFTMAGKGVTQDNVWTTIAFELPSNWATQTAIDPTDIVRFEIYCAETLPAGYKVDVDNVRFVDSDGKYGPAITSAQPELKESIDLTIEAVTPTQIAKAATLTYVFTGDAGTTYSYTPATLSATSANGNNQTWTSTFDGIPAHRMGDTLTMTLWYVDAVTGSLVKGETKDYSIKQYCTNMLTAYPNNTALCTLLGDLLTYGAAAQNYLTGGYGTLVTEGLTLTTTTFNAENLAQCKLGTVVDGEAGACKWTTATLVLDGTVRIRYGFTAASTEGLTVKVGDYTFTEFGKATAANGDEYNYVEIPVTASNFNTPYTASFVAEGEAQTLTYSVNHYLA